MRTVCNCSSLKHRNADCHKFREIVGFMRIWRDLLLYPIGIFQLGLCSLGNFSAGASVLCDGAHFIVFLLWFFLVSVTKERNHKGFPDTSFWLLQAPPVDPRMQRPPVPPHVQGQGQPPAVPGGQPLQFQPGQGNN